MGLDTSHDCWHAPYSAFYRFRQALLRAAGLPLGPGKPWDSEDGEGLGEIDWERAPKNGVDGEWGDEKPYLKDGTHDPILFLVAHSDCDGVIHPQQGLLIAKRLEELLPTLESDWHRAAQRWIDGLTLAADRGEDVDFH